MLRKLLGVAVAATVAMSAAPAVAYGDTPEPGAATQGDTPKFEAVAQDDTPEEPEESGPEETAEDAASVADADAAEMEDLQQAATEEGITLEQAVARYGWQDDFVKVANQARDSFPDTYAGAVVAEDGSSASIAFKGEVPATVTDLARTVHAPVKVVGGRPYSEEELRQTLKTTHYEILARADVATSAGEYDVERGVVTIEAQPKEPLADPAAKERFRAALQLARLAGSNPAIKVEVKVADQVEVQPQAYIRGGGLLNTTGAQTVCTTGFTVKKGSTTGISTAAHCGDDSKLRYHNHDTNDYTIVTRKSRHEGGHGDMAWYSRGGYTAAKTFYYNKGKTRYVDETRWAVQGVRLSNYGRTSGYKSSAKIYRINVCVDRVCDMVAMDKMNTKGGDSGGPWFNGTSAYGIHMGWAKIGGKKRSMYSEVRYLPQALGVTVLER
ncbi:S1 family peptidase [Nonomuraea sp. NPDC050691]|uniref:S1 family peptidase n=1 Tax=Nonomuraea sp. NPDC050691 TaxID=3155661 RepID=UPI0033DE3081